MDVLAASVRIVSVLTERTWILNTSARVSGLKSSSGPQIPHPEFEDSTNSLVK